MSFVAKYWKVVLTLASIVAFAMSGSASDPMPS
jgi:hypothetical protein